MNSAIWLTDIVIIFLMDRITKYYFRVKIYSTLSMCGYDGILLSGKNKYNGNNSRSLCSNIYRIFKYFLVCRVCSIIHN